MNATPALENPKRTRNTAIGVGVLALLLICCCVALVIIVVADPFGLGLLDRILGGPESVAQAMPADTGLYMGVDVVNAMPEKIERIIKPFSKVIEEQTGSEISEDWLTELDKTLNDELGLTITDDVMPWIGQYIGIGLLDLKFSSYGELEDGRVIVAVEARDKKKADEFLTKLQDGVTSASGDAFITSEYQGVTLYILDTSPDEQIAFCRSGSLVLFARSEADLQAAIDAQKGDSLADSQSYRNIVKMLPKERSVTFYLTSAQAQDLLNALQESMGASGGPSLSAAQLSGWSESAMSVSIVDAGLKLDSVMVYNPDELSETQRAMLESAGPAPQTDDLFPQGTLVYLVGQRLDLGWQAARSALAESATMADFDEAMQMFESQFGINPDTDVFPYLNGEFAMGLIPASEGMLAEQLQIALGFLVLAETSDAGALMTTMDNLSSKLTEMGMPPESSPMGDGSFYLLADPYTETPMLAYGVGEGHLMLGSSLDVLSAVVNGQPSLAQSDRYRQVWAAFPSGLQPVMYVDVGGLLGIIREGMSGYELEAFNETAQYIEPIQFIAAAGASLKNNAARSTVIVFIPGE